MIGKAHDISLTILEESWSDTMSKTQGQQQTYVVLTEDFLFDEELLQSPNHMF